MHAENWQELMAVTGKLPTQTVTVQIGEQETRIPLTERVRILIRLPRHCAVLETCTDQGQIVHTILVDPR